MRETLYTRSYKCLQAAGNHLIIDQATALLTHGRMLPISELSEPYLASACCLMLDKCNNLRFGSAVDRELPYRVTVFRVGDTFLRQQRCFVVELFARDPLMARQLPILLESWVRFTRLFSFCDEYSAFPESCTR